MRVASEITPAVTSWMPKRATKAVGILMRASIRSVPSLVSTVTASTWAQGGIASDGQALQVCPLAVPSCCTSRSCAFVVSSATVLV